MVFPIAASLIVAELSALWLLRRYFVGYLVWIISRLVGRDGAIWLYSLLTLPGLLVHEISHFLMAALLGIRTGKIELLPILSDSGNVEFGSVQVEKVDPLRLAVVGIAPMLAGLPLVGWMSLKMSENVWFWGYLICCAALHLLPSKRDLTYWPVIIPMVVGLGWLGMQFENQLLFESMIQGLWIPIMILGSGTLLFGTVRRIVQWWR